MSVWVFVLVFLLGYTFIVWWAIKPEKNSAPKQPPKLPHPQLHSEKTSSERASVEAWWASIYNLRQTWAELDPDTLVIATPHCVHVEWLALQYRGFQKYLTQPFFMIVANDAPTTSPHHHDIKSYCQTKPNILHLPIPPNTRQHRDVVFPNTGRSKVLDRAFSERNAIAAQAAWVVATAHQGYVAMLDEDVILYDYLDLKDTLREKPVVAILQGRDRVKYMWVAWFLADQRRTTHLSSLEWECGEIDGETLDTGGWTAKWYKHHASEVRAVYDNKLIPESQREFLNSLHFNEHTLSEKYEDQWIHYRGGCGWMDEDPESRETRRKRFFQGLHDRLTDSTTKPQNTPDLE